MRSFVQAHRATLVVALLSAAVATVLGAIASANHFQMMIGEGSPMPWRHAVVMEMPFWYSALLLTPLLVWALHRFPDRAHGGAVRFAQHLAIATIWIVAQAALDMGTRDVLGTGLKGPPPTYPEMLRDALVSGFLGRVLTYGAIVGVIYALTYYTRYRERDLAASQLEARLAETQLRMLRMQLNPHFLFNAMNTAVMLTRAGRTDESVAMLLQLSGLMRDALRSDAPQSVPLRDELKVLGRYIDVEQVRFGGRLAFDVEVPAALMDVTVPSFLLQPLVENAIRHGRAGADGTATVRVRGVCSGDTVDLSVWDDGTCLEAGASGSGGVGLQNVRERLSQLYGARHTFNIGRAEQGTEVRISFPLRLATRPS